MCTFKHLGFSSTSKDRKSPCWCDVKPKQKNLNLIEKSIPLQTATPIFVILNELFFREHMTGYCKDCFKWRSQMSTVYLLLLQRQRHWFGVWGLIFCDFISHLRLLIFCLFSDKLDVIHWFQNKSTHHI